MLPYDENMTREQALYLFKLLIFIGIYYLSATFSLTFDPVNTFASLFWLPSGISLAVLLLNGKKYWPGVLIGAFLANAANGAPLLVAFGIACGNTLEALTATYFLKKFIHIHHAMDRVTDVVGLFIFAGVVSTIFSATIGVTSLLLGDIVTSGDYLQTWIAWWVGDMVSTILITPFILVWSTRIAFIKKPLLYVEASLWAFVLVFSWVIVFQNVITKELANSPSTYWIFPPLTWAAVRFGQRWTITAILLTSIVAIVSTLQGTGPFIHTRLSDSLLSLHIFMGVIAVTSMIFAAVVSERKLLERRKDNFISMASHELKTPITSSKSYLQVLKKRFEKEKGVKAKYVVSILSKSDEQLDKLTILINDLLDVSKMHSGKLSLRQEQFNFDSFVDATIESVQPSIATHKIKKIGVVKKKILGDQNRLAQVLINLLSNAAKYSPNAKRIVVKVKSDKKNVIIQVQDFGIGMSSEVQEKIFEPFFQVQGVKRDGLGLGLHIASEIIKGHGGNIWAESKRGKGSTFSFSLPFEQSIKHRKRFI